MSIEDLGIKIQRLEKHLLDSTAHAFTAVRNETLTGTADGTNTLFKMTKVAEPNDTLMIFVNGLYKKRDVDYTHAGIVVEMTTAPATDVAVMAFYRYSFKLHDLLRPELIRPQRRRRDKKITRKRGAAHPVAVL